jgi:hypothetical protein
VPDSHLDYNYNMPDKKKNYQKIVYFCICTFLGLPLRNISKAVFRFVIKSRITVKYWIHNTKLKKYFIKDKYLWNNSRDPNQFGSIFLGFGILFSQKIKKSLK